jgi:alcohol dehydrogenase (cytochrome c)
LHSAARVRELSAAVTPTAGGVTFFGDIGGDFYTLATGENLWGQDTDGAIAGGLITYTANGAQKISVAAGFTMVASLANKDREGGVN